MPPPVFRFAPSPNGYLHLGHAYSALLNFNLARQQGGTFLLRIEDIDQTRCRPEFETAIYEDLAWLGISWAEPVRRQSDHLLVYRDAIARLLRLGVIYPAFDSRSQIERLVAEHDAAGGWPRDPDGAPLYPGGAKASTVSEREIEMQSGRSYALRLDTAVAIRKNDKPLAWNEQGAGPGGETGMIVAQPQAWGDVVIARKDAPSSYHVCVVIDDALQGISHVVRGHDLFWATSLHRLLQNLLDLPVPVYHHHNIVLDEDGEKLSKSTHATALRELRAAGVTAAEIRRRIGLAIPSGGNVIL